MTRVRCAIYTRKSSEEGLEQGFNSLDAQREACSAYILSQAGQGWEQVADTYDDGGLSGGTLERPALQRLLADVAAGRIDIIVVYKVDRLTRSLLDFAKLVEAFDKADVSFVSITQSFNTTTSMGRLTLNMLLSFAQFEREVTAERIRDKIAASKAKGMWMGGTPPLGYKPDGRSLAVVEEHAALIRDIFARYLATNNVRHVQQQLELDGVRTPERRYSKTGNRFGGVPFSRGQLYAILRNPVYAGRIVHGEQSYPGQHSAIIDSATREQVQQRLSDNRQGARTRTLPSRSLLAGKIIDNRGEPLIATHATKGTQRYRYYVSRDAHHGTATGNTLRIPAREIESLVAERIAALFDDPIEVIATAGLSPTPKLMSSVGAHAASIAAGLRGSQREYLDKLLARVRVGAAKVEIEIVAGTIATLLAGELADSNARVVTVATDVRLTRTGRVVRLVHKDGSAFSPAVSDLSLVKLVATAHRWWATLRRGEVRIIELAAWEGVTASWMTRVVRLAFLSPQVLDAVLLGTLRDDFDVLALTRPDAVPKCWKTQRSSYLASPQSDG